MKKYMKFCLSDLYRKVSAQIRRDLKIKDAENRLRLYKYYIPLIVDAVSDSIKVDRIKLSERFVEIAEKHVKKEITPTEITVKNTDDVDSKPKKIIVIKEKYNNSEKKNTTINQKEGLKNLSKKNVYPRKKVEKLTLDDFNRR
jgi:hypothetical protein